MNARQERFVQEYLLDMNATQAYIRAGYSPGGAGQAAEKLLKNAEIADLIAKSQKKAAETFERSHGSILQDIEEIGSEARSAGAFAPALKAKELIGKHFSMWPARVELTGKDGGAIQVEGRSALDLTRLEPEERQQLQQLLLKARKQDEPA